MHVDEYPAMFAVEDHHWWFLAKRSFVDAVLPTPKKPWRILDMGAGTGGMSLFLQSRGTVTCIEGSAAAVAFLKRRQLTVIHSTIEQLALQPETCDLITLCDVLYHKNITSDRAVIAQAYRLLKPGGILLITDCALPFFMGPYDERMQARERYTLPAMTDKVRAQGFTIRRQTYTYCFVFPLFILTRIHPWFQKKVTVSPPHPLLNTLLSCICGLESRLLRHYSFPIGSSLLVVAEKP